MAPFSKILVAVDFSATSERALDCARALADVCGASLHLVHVIAYPVGSPEATQAGQADACRHLSALLDETDRQQRHATTACLVGAVAPALADYAQQQGHDLLVMGTHRHGPSFQMARGSIAESVLGMAPCAVLAVKHPGAAASEAALDPPWAPPSPS